MKLVGHIADFGSDDILMRRTLVNVFSSIPILNINTTRKRRILRIAVDDQQIPTRLELKVLWEPGIITPAIFKADEHDISVIGRWILRIIYWIRIMVGKFPAAKINFHSTIVIKLNPVEVRIRVIGPDFVDNNGIGQQYWSFQQLLYQQWDRYRASRVCHGTRPPY